MHVRFRGSPVMTSPWPIELGKTCFSGQQRTSGGEVAKAPWYFYMFSLIEIHGNIQNHMLLRQQWGKCLFWNLFCPTIQLPQTSTNVLGLLSARWVNWWCNFSFGCGWIARRAKSNHSKNPYEFQSRFIYPIASMYSIYTYIYMPTFTLKINQIYFHARKGHDPVGVLSQHLLSRPCTGFRPFQSCSFSGFQP